jgi:hypothetical protein
MFDYKTKEIAPEVVIKKEVGNVYTFETGRVPGVFFRVIPDGFREIFLIQMLEQYREKFAPAKGNGVLISESAMKQITA